MEMEILLYAIIIILLITNKTKIKSLTHNLKSLESKIDALSHLHYKKKAKEIFTSKITKIDLQPEEKKVTPPEIAKEEVLKPAIPNKTKEIEPVLKKKLQASQKQKSLTKLLEKKYKLKLKTSKRIILI